LPIIAAMLDDAKQADLGGLSADEARERQAERLSDLTAMRGTRKMRLPSGLVIEPVLPAKHRVKEQRERLKSVGGTCRTTCAVSISAVIMKPYEPGAIVVCPECGNPVRMPTVPNLALDRS